MKIIFFGASEFAVPALKRLREAGYNIAAVITQPDKPAGRKQDLLPSPVKTEAKRLGIKILQPEVLEIGNWKLEIPEAPLYIVASYGKIIPANILQIPRLGVLNIHPSLLPKYRGPSPIQAAILNGDKETGVTIIKLDEEMDHGPILASRKLKVESEKFKELHGKLAGQGAELLIKILPEYIAGKIKPAPQDHSKATYTKIITKDDARIDWAKSAKEIDRQVRAYSDWPVAWTSLEKKRLKIHSATPATSPLPSPISEREKGEVQAVGKNRLFIATGTGQLEILSLQLEGGKRLEAKDFLNGYPRLNGKILV